MDNIVQYFDIAATLMLEQTCSVFQEVALLRLNYTQLQLKNLQTSRCGYYCVVVKD